MSMCSRVLLSRKLIKPAPGAFMCSKQPRAELLSPEMARGSQRAGKDKSHALRELLPSSKWYSSAVSLPTARLSIRLGWMGTWLKRVGQLLLPE